MSTRRPKKQPPSIAGVTPPHSLEAERAVLSAGILVSDKIDAARAVGVEASSFFSDAHAQVWAALVELRDAGAKIDTVTVCEKLREHARLAAVGGTAYVSVLVDSTPAVAHVEAHADIVVTLARRRATIASMQRLTAEGYARDVDPEAWAHELRKLSDVAPARSPVADAWAPVTLEDLTVAPPPRAWLLRHPTRAGRECAPGDGDGLLPLGKVGGLLAEGGTGKTTALVQLAVSVVTGRPWLGYVVGREAVGGSVLLALGEDNNDDSKRQLFEVSDGLGLSAAERALVVERVVRLPLHGHQVALLQRSPDRELVDSPILAELRRRLASRQRWSLVVFDPLSRWAGPDAEVDAAAATRTVVAFESFTRSAGGPTVLVAHHSSKDARKQGKADSRGVTAITDGFRWAATMTSTNDEIEFKQVKSNHSRRWKDDEAVRLTRRGGVLCVVSEAELEAREDFAEADRTAKSKSRLDADVQRMVSVLTEHGGMVPSQALWIEWARLGTGPGRNAIGESVTRGLVVRRKVKGVEVYALVGGGESPPHTPQSESGASVGPVPNSGSADESPRESARVRESATPEAACA